MNEKRIHSMLCCLLAQWHNDCQKVYGQGTICRICFGGIYFILLVLSDNISGPDPYYISMDITTRLYITF